MNCTKISLNCETLFQMPVYFIGIVAPPAINNQVMAWKTYMLQHFNCKVALRSPAHITLIPPFNLKTDVEPQLNAHIRGFSATQIPFTINLHNFSAFPPRVIFAGVELSAQLKSLQQNIEAYLINKNYHIKVSTRPFHPHVTIANRDLSKEDFPTAFDHFKKISFNASFEATHIDLLVSKPDGWQVVSQAPMQTFDM
jgi:2'-5' RNA ligase